MKKTFPPKYKIALLILTFLIPLNAVAQSGKGSISGKLADSSGKTPLSLATISVFHAKDTSLITYRLSDMQGAFKVPGIPFDDSVRIIITHTGSETFRKTLKLSPDSVQSDLGVIRLNPDERVLDEVLVIAERPPVIVRNDTIEFNAEAFKTLPNALVEDLLKKLPGVDVDGQGNIAVNGRKVTKLYVDGKEFFGSDPQMASKNLPANIIDKIQVTDDKEQLRQNPDLPPGQTGQVINLKLKKAIQKGWFGKAYAGAGTNDRYEAGGIVNLFRDTLQVSALAYSNNLNRPGFGIGDVQSIGGFNRSGLSSVMVMSDGGFALNDISFGGTGRGIQRSSGGGININNQIRKNFTVNLQYFYGQINSDIRQLNNRQQFFDDTAMVTRNTSDGQNNNYTNRIGGFVKWAIDSTSNFEFRPSLTLNKLRGRDDMHYVSSNNHSGLLNESDNLQSDLNDRIEFVQNISYDKSFRKKGRSLYTSVYFKLSSDDNNRENNTNNIFYENQQGVGDLFNQLRKRQSGNTSAGGYVTYNEPLTKNTSLGLRETLNILGNSDDINTFTDLYNNKEFDVPVDSLTDGFTRRGLTSSTRLFLKFQLKGWTLTPGINYDIDRFNNHFQKNPEISQRIDYIYPSLQIRKGKWTISYEGNIQQPSIDNLQPVLNNSNPLLITRGNPELKPSKSYSLYANSYSYDPKSNINYSLYFSGSVTNNAIVQTRTIDKNGIQTTMPINANGIWSAYASANISKQFKFQNDWKLSTGGSVWTNYQNGLIVLNDTRETSANWSINPGVNISFNFKDVLELRQDYRLIRNKSTYTGDVFPGLETTGHISATELIIRMPKHFVWESNIEYRHTPDVAPGIQKDIVRWNAAVNYLFLKEEKGQLKLSVYDLLNQNTQVYRSISANYIQDSETSILKRYLLLTFTYNIRKIGGKVGGKERLFLF